MKRTTRLLTGAIVAAPLLVGALAGCTARGNAGTITPPAPAATTPAGSSPPSTKAQAPVAVAKAPVTPKPNVASEQQTLDQIAKQASTAASTVGGDADAASPSAEGDPTS